MNLLCNLYSFILFAGANKQFSPVIRMAHINMKLLVIICLFYLCINKTISSATTIERHSNEVNMIHIIGLHSYFKWIFLSFEILLFHILKNFFDISNTLYFQFGLKITFLIQNLSIVSVDQRR